MSYWKLGLRLVLVVVAVVLFGLTLASWRAYAQLDDWMEKTRAAGEPVNLADLEPKDVLPDDNSVTLLLQVRDSAKALEKELIALDACPPKIDATADADPERITKIALVIGAYPEAFDAIDRAAQRSRFAWPRDYTVSVEQFLASLLDNTNDIRMFARLQDARARSSFLAEKYDQAARQALQIVRMARLQDEEPTLVLYLVNIACRSVGLYTINGILQGGPVSAETHEVIEQELAAYDGAKSYEHALKMERVIGCESFRGFVLKLGPTWTGGWNEYLSVMDHELANVGKLPYEMSEKDAIVTPKNALAAGIVPAINASREATVRIQIFVNCLRILNAIQSRGIDADPVVLSSLGLPPSTVLDPYSGNPLIVKRSDKGWLIYSVGIDLTDDGGMVAGLTDIGFGPGFH
ncbi:MAG: hypothetical protein R3E01_28230 [Pirellulaceae bacterium]